jgi:hypothetical protein
MTRPKPKSEFVSAAGITFEIMKALSTEVRNLGGSDDHLKRIINERSLASEIAELLVRRPVSSGYDMRCFKFSVSYDKSFEDQLAEGCYDFINPNITEKNFPVTKGDTNVEAVLLKPYFFITHEEILAYMERKGLRPATTAELNAFGSNFKNEQLEHIIVGLGSLWLDTKSDVNYVTYLWAHGWKDMRGRCIELSLVSNLRVHEARYLAIRKSPLES